MVCSAQGKSGVWVSALRGAQTRTAMLTGVKPLRHDSEWRPALEPRRPDPLADQNCRLPDQGGERAVTCRFCRAPKRPAPRRVIEPQRPPGPACGPLSHARPMGPKLAPEYASDATGRSLLPIHAQASCGRRLGSWEGARPECESHRVHGILASVVVCGVPALVPGNGCGDPTQRDCQGRNAIPTWPVPAA